MNADTLIPIVAGSTAIVLIVFLLLNRKSSRTSQFRGLMAEQYTSSMAELRERISSDETGEQLERFQTAIKKDKKAKKEPTIEEKMFRAGIFSRKQKADFKRLQVLAPIIGAVVFLIIGRYAGEPLLSMLVGLILGLYFPFKVLDRKIQKRHEEILFFLPLVIEQISIGVSSSLDIGPCLMRIVEMADERDTHNPVTELLRYAQFHIKSGVGLEEALNEVGQLSGQHDLKHAFMALSQVAKFGGEISKQLQDLADSVSAQREARVEERIKKLELDATAPVALVFFGYLVILLVGFGLQIVVNMG